MNIHRTNRFTAKAGQSAALIEQFKTILPVILSSEGCISCRLFQSDESTDTLLIIEEWASKQAHQNAAKNIRPEDFSKIMSLLATTPEGEYFSLKG